MTSVDYNVNKNTASKDGSEVVIAAEDELYEIDDQFDEDGSSTEIAFESFTGIENVDIDDEYPIPEFSLNPTFGPDLTNENAHNFSAEDRAELSNICHGIFDAAPSSEIQKRWSEFVNKMAVNGGCIDPNALVQQVLRDAYLSSTEDLHLFAKKVKFYNEIRKQIRAELKAARDCLKPLPNDAKDDAKVDFSKTPIETQFFGDEPLIGEPDSNNKCTTKRELEDYIKELEEKMSTVGEDAQLANTDMQNTLQKQQQTLQMISNISKMLYDTAQGVIRKFAG
ncbi:MAG: hypothetical protein JW841_05945 [Deltaproteobacteria bacterium]|nr:hypothetical protein [Deltaproteobacteria bacterium]